MCLDCSRKLEYLERVHPGTVKTGKLHTKWPQLADGFESRTCLLKVIKPNVSGQNVGVFEFNQYYKRYILWMEVPGNLLNNTQLS